MSSVLLVATDGKGSAGGGAPAPPPPGKPPPPPPVKPASKTLNLAEEPLSATAPAAAPAAPTPAPSPMGAAGGTSQGVRQLQARLEVSLRKQTGLEVEVAQLRSVLEETKGQVKKYKAQLAAELEGGERFMRQAQTKIAELNTQNGASACV